MVVEGKARLRSELLAARRAVPEDARRAESARLVARLADLVGDDTRTVAAYVPLPTEPGAPDLLDMLSRLCDTVLIPVARNGDGGEPLPMHWGRYIPGRVIAGPFGAREPAEPWLPPTAVARARVVLVPALAVDRRGIRLGRGGGFYDRSLPLCTRGTRLVAVVRDEEVVEEVPGETHDVPMTHALTPGRGLIPLGDEPAADGGPST